MSSTGQALGYVVGAVVGYFTGGVGYVAMGAAMGGMVGTAIDPPKGPKIQGPRLTDLAQQGASYGAPVPRIYGSCALYGNIFWIENNAIRETSNTQSSGGKGGGGGAETTTYSYSATFALGLGEGPIAAIRRIWISSKLFYDAGSSDIAAIAASNKAGLNFRFYEGSPDQMPDPRMQAALGADNTPAFRGLSYIVFDDLPLTDYGNSLQGAQIKVEVVQFASRTAWSKTTDIADTGAYFKDQDGGVGEPYIVSANGELVVYVLDTMLEIVISADGHFLGARPAQQASIMPKILFDSAWWYHCGPLDYGGLSDAPIWWAKVNKMPASRVILARGAYPDGAWPIDANLPQNREVLGVIVANDKKSVLVISGDVGVNTPGISHTAAVWTRIDGTGRVLDSGAINESVSQYSFGYSRAPLGISQAATAYDSSRGIVVTIVHEFLVTKIRIWEFDATGVMVVDLYETLDINTYTWPSVYVENDVITVVYGKRLCIYTRGLLSQSYPLLSDVVEAECLRSSLLTSVDINAASLADTVLGYRISSLGAIRAAIDPLQGAWPFDVIQSGYQITFRRRLGLSSVASVPSIDLGARNITDKTAAIMTQSREMDSQLASRVIVTHFDIAREYDIGEQYAERLNIEAINEQRIELAVVMGSADAARVAETLLYLYWLERRDFSFTLPPTYRALEPGDIIDVDTGAEQFALRLVRIQYLPDGRLECDAKPHGAIYSSVATGVPGMEPASKIAIPGSTHLELLDIPTLLDGYDSSGMIVAMCGYSSGWTGATLFRSQDAGVTWSPSNTFVVPATIGLVSSAIGAPADHRMIDSASRLVVRLYGESFISSVGEAQLLNGSNHFAYGAPGRWEIIGAKTASLLPDGSFALIDLLRGRMGSESNMANHQANDRLVMLNSQSVQFMPLPQSSLGITANYKAVTAGSLLADTRAINTAYVGVNQECLSPVWLNGNRNPSSNDWTLEWLRRTRVGGEWRAYVDAPLGEASEAYEIEIYASASYTTLKRTITGLTTASAIYTSAQQVADFGSNQATLYVKVYQLSANVGRGNPLTTSITR